VDFVELRQGFLQYLPVGALVGVIFLVELVLVLGTWATSPGMLRAIDAPVISADRVTNTEAIGKVLYTTYIHYFQLSGIVLLVAMIGAIVLTLRHKPNVKRQDVGAQVARTPADSIEVVKVKSGQGI
jgi:NADH-quinone oxidoreductase subunit J